MSKYNLSHDEQEKVLVVDKGFLMPFCQENSIKVTDIVDENEIYDLITAHGKFIERSDAENDTSKKQIIPYAYLLFEKKIYLLRRKSTQSESRLHNKLSLGVGGHINSIDVINEYKNVVKSGLHRELDEELIVDNIEHIKLKAAVNDESTEVGRVHTGLIFEIKLGSPDCSVREVDKMEGSWVEVTDLYKYYDEMETWSQAITKYIFHI